MQMRNHMLCREPLPVAKATVIPDLTKAVLMKIHFIITGGTIDNCLQETGTTPTNSFVEQYVTRINRPPFEVTSRVLFLKDSREITEGDRRAMLREIQRCGSSHVIVTHGTFTMVETAQFLKVHLKTVAVVVTGAMVPMGEPGSDAELNLEFAFATIQAASPGVWVGMHGKLWDPQHVRKNVERGMFESVV